MNYDFYNDYFNQLIDS